MAIQTRIINGSYAEIYVGRGNFITQFAPTYFHQFYTRKILTESESIDDFREVTEAEKTALEESDARWKEPSDELIEQAEAAGIDLDEIFTEIAEESKMTRKQRKELQKNLPIVGQSITVWHVERNCFLNA